jgi:hypothetical protein
MPIPVMFFCISEHIFQCCDFVCISELYAWLFYLDGNGRHQTHAYCLGNCSNHCIVHFHDD